MAQNAFFFPHALKPAPGGNPGRVSFDVLAHVTDGTTAWMAPETVIVDGFEPNRVGGNQDPCVIAEPAPFHSFCRIGVPLRDERLRLPEAVQPGDLIIYGKFEPVEDGPIRRVWVDTVLVVETVIPWATDAGGLTNPANFAARLTGQADGKATDAYRFNLCDAEPDGFHASIGIKGYGVIVGRVNKTDPTALTRLDTSFVPLAAGVRGARSPVMLGRQELGEHWQGIETFLDGRVRRKQGWSAGGVTARFQHIQDAQALCRAVIARSEDAKGTRGVVAIPPFAPLQTPLRVPMACSPRRDNLVIRPQPVRVQREPFVETTRRCQWCKRLYLLTHIDQHEASCRK